MQFSELGLHEKLLTSLSDKDFNEPTAIQKATINKAFDDQDLIALKQAQERLSLIFYLFCTSY